MKYIVTFFWAFAIGQAVCYLGGALQSGTYNFELSTIISLCTGVITILVAHFAKSGEKKSQNA